MIDKMNDFYFVHNLWEGLEIRIPDILMVFFNVFVLIFCLILWGIYLIMKLIEKKNDSIQVGPLCHLCK